MKKLLTLAVAATLLGATTATTFASAPAVSRKLPLYGYDYGYRAGERYLNTNPTQAQVAQEWHRANDNVAYYNSTGDTGSADYYQGYADGLHYYDSN